jgi:tetratricopeptide (TPR) repeat protein
MVHKDHTPEDQDGAFRSALEHIQHEEEFQELVHQLSHRGMALAAQGRINEVEQVFSEVLNLARERHLPRWEAQILFNTGVIFDRSAKPVVALSFFERALALFVEHGPLRMVVNAGIFLGNMLWKTGEPARAEEILQHALGQAHLGYNSKQIDLHEYQAELFGVYSELVHAYYVLGQYERALETYQCALSDGVPSSLEELHTLDLVVLDLYRDSGAFQHAVQFGKKLLEHSGGPETAQDFQFVSKVHFSLGIAHSMAEAYAASLLSTQESYHAFRRSRSLEPRSPLLSADEDIAFRGRVFVNLGTAFNGLARRASLERNEQDWLRHVKAALSFWKHGEELLTTSGAADVTIAREQLTVARAMFDKAELFERLVQASEFTYQALLREMGLEETDEPSSVGSGEFLVSPTALGLPGVEDEEDLEESERLLLEGRRALLKKHYLQAQEYLEEALEFDPDGLTSAHIWYALSCLWTGEAGLDEAASLFGEMAAQGDVEGEGALARILSDWSDMCFHSTRQAYLDSLRKLCACESEEDFQDMLEPSAFDLQRGGAEGELHAGIMYAVKGNCDACLRMLSGVSVAGHAFSPWIRSFWQAMALATSGSEEQAAERLGTALAQGMPPLLMGPLRWLKPATADPASWFARVVRPLFLAHGCLYGETPEQTPPDGCPSLPSQAVKIAPIRPGLLLAPCVAEGGGEENGLELTLPGVRGPGGRASLVFVEFDAGGGSSGQDWLAWPTKFAIRYANTPAAIAGHFQEIWIDYTPGRSHVQLVDLGFRTMSNGMNAIPTAGRDYLVGHGSYGGRGGIFWVDEECGLPVVTLGTTTKLTSLPEGMLAYLQALVDEAQPSVEMICDLCYEQVRPVNGVWCEHIWFCPQCHHISSPVERSRKLISASPRLCTHRFPKHPSCDLQL